MSSCGLVGGRIDNRPGVWRHPAADPYVEYRDATGSAGSRSGLLGEAQCRQGRCPTATAHAGSRPEGVRCASSGGATPAPEWLASFESAVPISIASPITVSDSLQNPHRLVVLSALYLMKAHPRNGRVPVSEAIGAAELKERRHPRNRTLATMSGRTRPGKAAAAAVTGPGPYSPKLPSSAVGSRHRLGQLRSP